MKPFLTKSFYKKLTILILLICMLSESIFLPNMSVVYATESSNDLNSDEIVEESTSSVSTYSEEERTTDVDNSASDEILNEENLSSSKDTSTIDATLDFETDTTKDSNTDSTKDSETDSTENIQNNDEDSDDETLDQVAISEENFPDATFRDYILQNIDFDKDNQLSEEEIAQVESIDVSNMGIRSLAGIEYFTNLFYLYCNGNKLTSLDIDALVNLTVLNCSYNYLTNLDLSNCTSLISFEGNNNATAITLDENNSFDLSSLTGFDIKDASDWSENVTITDNNLVFNSDQSQRLITYRYNVNSSLEDSYVLCSLVITSDEQPSVEINEENFPDVAFLNYLKDTFDQDNDLVLTTDEISKITYLYLPNLEITSLSGIEYFTNLVSLNFDDNAVSYVDLNSLINLRSLSCSNNTLTQLSVEQLVNLFELYCNDNQLYSLDLSNSSSLEVLECENNTYEVSETDNTVLLSALDLLDLSRTAEWSEGEITLDNNLLLDNITTETYITYTYQSHASNETLDSIKFTLKVTPSEEETIQESVALYAETKAQVVPEVQPDLQEQQTTATQSTEAVVSPSIVSYTVAFNSDGANEIVSQSIISQGKASIPTAPVKSGYIFEGWYNGETAYDFNTVITNDITLTAHWTKVSPKKPTIKSLKNSSKSKMKITINTVKNIDGYEVSYSTYKNAKKNAIIVDSSKRSLTVKNLVKGKTYYVRVRTYSYDSTGQKIYSSYSKIKKLKIKKGLSEAKATSTSATIKSSKLTSKDTIKIEATTKNIVKSSDNYYYLFSLPSYKNSISKSATPLSSTLKATTFNFNVASNLNTSSSLLYSKFVIAVKVSSGYKIISKAKYVTNPQKAADFTYSFPTASSKKGLQINAGMLNDVKDLGVKHAAFNIPLNLIIASSGENNYRSSIDYEYNGKTYWFRKGMIAAYDSLFRNLENQDIVVSAIVLLGWRDDLTYLITPSGREKGHNYYNFNTSNKKAREQLEATFSFLAERYASGSQNGKVVNWIIGNEINSFDAWNYAGTNSLSKYAKLYADSFRLAYNAIKSVYSNAKLYVSLDQCWTTSNSSTFGGKEFLEKFDSILKESGDISWNLAYHAYPSPLTDPRFWKNANGQSQNNENTPVISISNISVLTKYIKKHYGKNTRIILSEQGFTSAAPYGEKTQAAAIAYAYYLAEFNSMIDSFILSRHVDNVAETKNGLNLGLWSNTPGQVEEAYQKKYAWKVYKYMDTPSSTSVTKFALKIIGAKNWKKIVPGYSSKKFKSMPKAN